MRDTKEPKKRRTYEGYEFQAKLETRGYHTEIEYATKKDRANKEKADQRYVVKQISPSLEKRLSEPPEDFVEYEIDYKKQVGGSLEKIFGSIIKEAFRDAWKEKCRQGKSLWETYVLWSSFDKFYEVFAEATAGEILRFGLGNSQPKYRIVVSQDLKLFIASREVKHKSQFNPAINQTYLKNYAAGLDYNLLCQNIDLHANQILINENGRAVFIDFGDAFKLKRCEKLNDPHKHHIDLPRFNAQDIAYQPFVGPNGGLGGTWMPYNWLGSYGVKGRWPNSESFSQIHVHDRDPCTYKNPRFQQDKHRGILKILLTPDSVFTEIVKFNQELLSEHFNDTNLFKGISDIILNVLFVNRYRFIVEAAKIPEFIEYLENLSLLDLVEIAKEFHEFMLNNKRYEIFAGLKMDREGLFKYCLNRVTRMLQSAPFNFNSQEMSIGLRYFQSLSENDDAKLIQRILWTKPPGVDEFFAAPSQEAITFMAQFSVVDHLFMAGELSAHIETAKIPEIPPGLEGKLICARLESIIKTLEVRRLIRKVIEHFSLELFLQAILSVGENKKAPEIPEGPGTVEQSHLFLQIEPIVLQRIIEEGLLQSGDFEQECLARNLLCDIEKIREQKIRQLRSEDYKAFSIYLLADNSVRLSSFLTQETISWKFLPSGSFPARRIMLNTFQILKNNPNWAEIEKITLELTSNIFLVTGFAEHHFNKSSGSELQILTSTLIDWVFGFEKTSQDHVNLYKEFIEPHALSNEVRLREFLNRRVKNKDWVPVVVDFLRQPILESRIGEAFRRQIDFYLDGDPVKNFLLELEKARLPGDAFGFFYQVINKLQDFFLKNPGFSIYADYDREYFLRRALDWLLKGENLNNIFDLLQILKKLRPKQSRQYDQFFDQAFRWGNSLRDKNITFQNLSALFFILYCQNPSEQHYFAFWIREILKEKQLLPPFPKTQKARVEALESLRFIISARNYKNLIAKAVENAFLILYDLNPKSEGDLMIKVFPSEIEKEQLSIIHALVHDSELNMPDLMEELKKIELKKTSAEFIFEVMEKINDFSQEKEPVVQKKCESIIRSLIYALPFRDKIVEQQTTAQRNSSSANLAKATDHLKKTYLGSAGEVFSGKLVEDEQKVTLLLLLAEEEERLEEEEERLRLLPSKSNELAKISKRKERVSIARTAVANNKCLTWFAVDQKLRSLAEDSSINNHRETWKNNWSFFKTQSRKNIDKIFKSTVQSARRTSLQR